MHKKRTFFRLFGLLIVMAVLLAFLPIESVQAQTVPVIANGVFGGAPYALEDVNAVAAYKDESLLIQAGGYVSDTEYKTMEAMLISFDDHSSYETDRGGCIYIQTVISGLEEGDIVEIKNDYFYREGEAGSYESFWDQASYWIEVGDYTHSSSSDSILNWLIYGEKVSDTEYRLVIGSGEYNLAANDDDLTTLVGDAFKLTRDIQVYRGASLVNSVTSSRGYIASTSEDTSGWPAPISTDAYDTGDLDVVGSHDIYVDDDWTGSSNGDVVDGHIYGQDAFSTIQSAIEGSASGATVNVAAGSYPTSDTIVLDQPINILGPTSGVAEVIGVGGDTVKVFELTSGDISIQNLTFTLAAQPSLNVGMINIPDLAISNISITNNKFYVDPQPGAMSTWYGQGIYAGRYITDLVISGNEIFNLRGGVIVHYNTAVSITNNVIYNTKGGIMNYTGSIADYENRIIQNNSWNDIHNEWDIVWNSGGGPYEQDYTESVLGVSQDNNDAYVTSLMTVTETKYTLEGNRSHVFVAPGGMTTTLWTYGNMNEPYATLQLALDAVVEGGTIYVAAGMYDENVVIDKQVSIIGAGGDAGTGSIFTTPATFDSKVGVIQISGSGTNESPILLQDLRIEPVGQAGISVGRFGETTGTNVSYLSLENVKVIGTNTNPSTEQERGLYVDLTSTLDHLVINNSAFDNLTYGWYFQKEVSADASTVSNVQVTNTTFNHNNHKGIYAEKLTDATFTSCEVSENGYDTSILPSYFAPWSAGVDLNLKAGTYQNVSFIDMIITDNGIGGSKEGVGLTVKARDDSSYAAYPASLDGVLIQGCLITGNERGVRIGEPDKDNAGPSNVVLDKNQILGNVQFYSGTDGTVYGDVINQSLSHTNASPNWWGSIAGPTNDQVEGDVAFQPWCAVPDCSILNPLTIPAGTPGADVQDILDNALPGATIIFEGSPTSLAGGFVINTPELTILLKDGTVIQNNSPCFEINANYTTITTESPLGAVCIPTGGSNGIEVNGDRINIVIEGLEIDGAAGTNGIDFDGVVTDLIVRDNYIHGLAGAGLYFAAAPAGVVQIQGNLFMDNTGNGIEAGALIIPAEYNAWGDVAGAAAGDEVSDNVDADPWTHVDLYLESSGTPWDDQVVLGEQITYAVKANLVNAMGADFVLEYPANLAVTSTITLGGVFEAEAVDSATAGELNFVGYQMESGTAVTGCDVTLFTVVFNTLNTGKDLPMNFDEGTDLFSMAPDTGGDPSTNIYATLLEDSEIDVILLPEMSSDDIQGYYLTGEPRDFSVQTVNPTEGAEYTNVIFRYTIYGADLTDIASFSNAVFGAMPLAEDGLGNLVGKWGNYPTGFAMTAPYDVTTTFNIEFNTAGDYVFELTLVDLVADTVLATLTDTAEVYDAPTMTPDIPATFMSDEQVEFSVNLTNPATGIETNVYAEIVLTGLVPADIQSLQYFEVADGLWHELPYDYDSVSGEITIHYGPATGFPMTAPYDVDALFRVIFSTMVNTDFAYTGALYDYDFDPDRELATMAGASTIYANFDVTGTVSMQGRSVRSGVQMALDGSYDAYSATSTSSISLNLGFADVIAGTYQITTVQDRYLNLTADLGKLVTIIGDTDLPALELKGGNANNDGIIGILDAGIIGGDYGTGTIADSGDVNFDDRVNIQDLALVGGNFDLTSEEAYAGWLGNTAEISGQILPDGAGNMHGELTGDLNLVIDAYGTGESGNISTFAGTISGDFTGSVTGTINAQGIDIMYATVTGSGFPEALRIFGTFPQTGIPGDFQGTVMIGPERPGITSVEITGPSTADPSEVVTLGLNIDPDDDREKMWSVYVDDAAYGTITQDGVLTIAGDASGKTITIIVTVLDDMNVSYDNFTITIN